MNFLADAQLPRRLARWLQERGRDLVHTEDLPRQNRTPDPSLLAKANAEQRVLVTKDADFEMSLELGKGPPKLLLVTTGISTPPGPQSVVRGHWSSVTSLLCC